MANIVIDKLLIEGIAKQNNEGYFNQVNEKISNILINAIENLSVKIPFISTNNVVLQPYNEILSGAFTDNSIFHYLLGIENAQLELNTAKTNNFWRNLKAKMKYAWENRRKRKKIKKNKNKEEKLGINVKDFDISKYNIYNLTDDLFDTIRLYLSETSVISQEDNILYIIGKDDFGVNTKIKIELCFYSNDVFKFFINKRKGFEQVDFSCRLNCLKEKMTEAGPNFKKMLKIFNVLYYYANNERPNAMFIESVLYNIPDKLFEEKNIYNCYLKIVNFLTLKPINNFNSINDLGKKIYNDNMLGDNQQVGLLKMLRMIADKK